MPCLLSGRQKCYGSDEKCCQTKFMNRLEGYINFVGQVRGKGDALYLKYREHLITAQSNQRVF